MYISDKLSAVNAAPELALAQYAAQAHAKHVENLALYVAYIWEYEFKLLVVRSSSSSSYNDIEG